jgi:hypothetical protein
MSASSGTFISVRRFAEPAVARAFAFIAFLLVATGASLAIMRYARYKLVEGVPRDSVQIPDHVVDIGLASDGALLGIKAAAAAGPARGVRVVAWDSLAIMRELFELVEPAAVRQPGPSRAKYPPSELADAKLAPLALRAAVLWKSEEGTYLSTGDARNQDRPFAVGDARDLAISPDGTILALARSSERGSAVQVLRVASASPETLFTVLALGVEGGAMAVSPRGRLAMVGADGVLSLTNPADTFSTPGRVSHLTFVGESQLAAVGQFEGLYVIDSLGSRRIAPAVEGASAAIAAQDSNIVAWRRGGYVNRYTIRTVRRTHVGLAVGIIGAGYALVTLIAVLYGQLQRRRRRALAALRGRDDRPRPTLPEPDVPKELIQACARGRGVLYAGAGLSAAADYPLWGEFVEDLVRWAADRDLINSKFKDSLFTALERGQTNSVAYSVVTTIEQAGRGEQLQAFLEQTFGSKTFTRLRLHRPLVDVGFSAAVTHNLDNLLEKAFVDEKPAVCTPDDSEQLASALSQGSRFVLKLYGTLERPPVLVAPAQFQAEVVTNASFAEFTQQLYVSRTLLFLGVSLTGITDYLESLNVHRTPDIQHFALVAITEFGWDIKAKELADRYGVTVLPFTPTEDFPEVNAFVTKLATQVREARERIANERAEEKKHRSALKRISLRNIGPFESLDVDLDANITVILGDNGLGKSTILRAIGLALAGSDQESALASGLTRNPNPRRDREGPQDGSCQIILETRDGKEYTTLLTRRSTEGVRIQFQPHTWQRGESQLALGFPPLRSVSSKPVSNPQIIEDRPRPMPSDVLPIVSGDPDSRVGDLKQWLVGMELRRNSTKDQGKTQRMLGEFFKTINVLLEGIKIDFKDLVVEGGEIRVATEDGTVPLHSLSQGTVSMIGLIGVLLPRLYDVHSASQQPKNEFAIALIDEIDAHMHPLWQQSLIPNLRKLFPTVQFIVTTHSPFIAAGREKNEIVRLRRDMRSRKIVIEPTYADTKGVDVATLLTGSLFGLNAPVDHQTQQDIVDRRQLAARKELSDSEKRRLQELNHRLAGVVTAPTADPEYNRYLSVVSKREHELSSEPSILTAKEEKAKLDIATQILAELRSKQVDQ